MAKSGSRQRLRLVQISEDMRHLCALLGQELLRWPDVSARSMFGLRAFYRGAVVFAMLPDKRALESPTAIAYKLPDIDVAGPHSASGLRIWGDNVILRV